MKKTKKITRDNIDDKEMLMKYFYVIPTLTLSMIKHLKNNQSII